ncbi:phage holin family protein [Raineyella sp.]|uniref:Phage holin family protein n=1 Tax=bioreactor metagenome TaxID=1076179 RepID=A0A645F762_9ZZZZ|nr:phage holin family protein [Raineyella sp.]MEA5155272.1 phage holin family protein [Raineyella sp.]
MIRFLANVVVNLVVSAVAFLVAWWLVPGVVVRIGGFITAVAVFTVAQAILAPFVFNLARRYANAVLGGVGIVSTLLALLVATLVSNGLTITGFSTWFVTALLVWLITALGGWLLMAYVVDRWLARRKAARRAAPTA